MRRSLKFMVPSYNLKLIKYRKNLCKLLLMPAMSLLLIYSGFSYNSNWDYQDRGGYFEGIKGSPISGQRVVLISALAGNIEQATRLPVKFKIKFYLKETRPVYITVQEMYPVNHYRLDRVEPHWQAGYHNNFEWSTNTVIQHLENLTMSKLGVVAKLDTEEPSNIENIAPVIFYHSSTPKYVNNYHFTFMPNASAEFDYEIYDRNNQSVYSRSMGRKPDGSPFSLDWDASGAVEGRYRLILSMHLLDKVTPIKQVINFYHKPVVE